MTQRLLALLILRGYLGVIFLIAAIGKMVADARFEVSMRAFLATVALDRALPWYQVLVRDLVLPHSGAFARGIVVAEAFVGAALLLGLATRVAGVLAMILLGNYLLAKGAWLGMPASNDAALFVSALSVVVGDAGQICGLDGWLTRRQRRSTAPVALPAVSRAAE